MRSWPAPALPKRTSASWRRNASWSRTPRRSDSWSPAPLRRSTCSKLPITRRSWAAIADIVIEVYAMDSVLARTLKLIETQGEAASAVAIAISDVYLQRRIRSRRGRGEKGPGRRCRRRHAAHPDDDSAPSGQSRPGQRNCRPRENRGPRAGGRQVRSLIKAATSGRGFLKPRPVLLFCRRSSRLARQAQLFHHAAHQLLGVVQ